MRPHYSGLWEHKILPGFVCASHNIQSTLHWLFPNPYGDPICTKLNQYSVKDFRELLCVSSELSFSLYGAPSSNMCFINSVFQSSMFWSVFSTEKDFRALFWFQLPVLQLEICLQEVTQEIILLYFFVSLLLEVTVCSPYGQTSKTNFLYILPMSHIIYSWKTIPVKVLHRWN